MIKTNVLQAYNRYVILANQYRHEQLYTEVKTNEIIEHISCREPIPMLVNQQSQFLSKRKSSLLRGVKEAHMAFTATLRPNGWGQGEHTISIPKTLQFGELIVAPRYQTQLNDALRMGLSEVDVPTIEATINMNGSVGTALVYGSTGLFGNLMPYN